MARYKPIILGVVALTLLGVGVFVGIKLLDSDGSSTSADDSISNPPIGCPKSTSIVVKSPEAGTQKISTTNSTFMQWTKSSGALIFTNYTLNPDSVYADITGDKVLTVIKLSRQDATDFAAGTYTKTSATSEETPNLYSSEYNISTVGLAGAVFDDESSVEITYFGSDYVCGKVTSQDSDSGINGDFIAKYIDKIY